MIFFAFNSFDYQLRSLDSSDKNADAFCATDQGVIETNNNKKQINVHALVLKYPVLTVRCDIDQDSLEEK